MQQRMDSLNNALHGKDSEKCQIQDCDREAELFCKQCDIFTCYRCRLLPCQSDTDQHNHIDIPVCVAESKEIFAQWKKSQTKRLENLGAELDKIATNIRSYGMQLANETPNNEVLGELTSTILPLLSTAHAEFMNTKEVISQEKSSLHLVESMELEGIAANERQLIHSANQLQLYEHRREIALSRYEPLVVGTECYDASLDPTGQKILVARIGGVDILDISTGEIIRTLEYDTKYVFAVEHYGSSVIVIAVSDISSESTRKKDVIILDSDYSEIRRWDIPSYASDLTVVDDKVFVTGSDDYHGNMKVFTLAGDPLPEFLWNGKPDGIACVPPCSIVFCDEQHHKVHKQQVSTGRRGPLWSAKVAKPRCVSIDDNGVIWVRSNVDDRVTIISRQGVVLQTIEDRELTDIGNIIDFNVYGDYLYVCHEQGMGRFHILYK